MLFPDSYSQKRRERYGKSKGGTCKPETIASSMKKPCQCSVPYQLILGSYTCIILLLVHQFASQSVKGAQAKISTACNVVTLNRPVWKAS